MKRLLAEPLLHFALLGGLLFFTGAYWKPWLADLGSEQSITITHTVKQRLAQNWFQQTGQAPSDTQMAALVQQHIADEVLFREALRLNLHENDPVIQLRLAKNMQFVDQSESSPEQLVDAALALGMLESDLVVRRRLIQRMQHHIESQVSVSQAEVLRYLQDHDAVSNKPTRYNFRHIFFSNDPANTQTPVIRAQRIHSQLETRPDEAEKQNLGDAFALGQSFKHLSANEIRQQFGEAMAEQITQAETGSWLGPVSSYYGQHLIKVDTAITPQSSPSLAERKKAIATVFKQKERRALQTAIQDLQKRYRIVVLDSTAAEQTS